MSNTESKTRGFDGNINAALLLLDRAISTVDDFVEAGHIPSDDELEEYLADVRIELIAWVERKCVPADNWIPIEDKSQLVKFTSYTICDSNKNVWTLIYKGDGLWHWPGGCKYIHGEITDYQPLPSAKL